MRTASGRLPLAIAARASFRATSEERCCADAGSARAEAKSQESTKPRPRKPIGKRYRPLWRKGAEGCSPVTGCDENAEPSDKPHVSSGVGQLAAAAVTLAVVFLGIALVFWRVRR